MALPSCTRVRIRSRDPGTASGIVRGQHVSVWMVLADGTEVPINNVVSATIRVPSRNEPVIVGLVLRGVELDIEGGLDDAESRAATLLKSSEDAARLLSETGKL